MKRFLALLFALLISLSFAGCKEQPDPAVVARKPVVYLYPEEEMEISVKLDYAGTLTSTYPTYENGWEITAQPDGTLTDAQGREYYCLFWEGVSHTAYDFSTGFVVPGEETAAFLEDALAQLGLTEKEANEFMIYWLPQMEHNAYNRIAFQTEAYTESAVLTVTPQPDSVIRVFMAWEPLDAFEEMEPQVLEPVSREGFAVVEWGGAKIE